MQSQYVSRVNKFGFSAGEIIVAIATLVLISTVVIYSFVKMNEKQLLDKSRVSIISIINEVRSSSLSSKDSNDHGVYIESDRVIAFIGSIYDSTDEKNSIYNLNTSLEISSVVPVSLVFKKITGELVNGSETTITISKKSDINASSSIVVYPTGITEKK